MPRFGRADEPGTDHHITNRGIAKRTMFERREDFRFFLAGLARAVHRGELEVLAYCLMGTHFHLLVRSLIGDLARAMHRVQLAASRRFNRTRRRDGSLVRGRYWSKPVLSETYRRVLVAYIDQNPVRAGLVKSPIQYPYGSAWHYARDSGPPWLSRSWVEQEVCSATGKSVYSPEDYLQVFGDVPDLEDLVEARGRSSAESDPLDDLVASSPAQVKEWMLRKAKLADGTRPGLPVIPLGWLEQLARIHSEDPWTVGEGRGRRPGWPVLYSGLGRELCGATVEEVARRLGISPSGVTRNHRVHRDLLLHDGEYFERAHQAARALLQGWRGE